MHKLSTEMLTTVNRDLKSKVDFRVIDVPSRKLMGGKDSSPIHRFWFLRDVLSPVRKVETAKKRLLYFYAANKQSASICLAATERSERDNMRRFFEKHSRYDKHSTDQCSMIHNSWESEFHLSYYQLLDGPITLRGIPRPESAQIPGGQGKFIARASVSFRFNGDFCDRFWTCHMLEYTHQRLAMVDGLFASKDYRQRKILEQHYFASILTSLNQSMGDILAELKDRLAFKRGSLPPSIPSNTAYTYWSAVWREFEPLIQTLEDDLVSTQITIGRWESREEDRGKEQPRWTRNDERKHRASITRIRRNIKHQRDKLQHLQSNVKLLRESYSNGLVKAREELSFRSEQNIARFTYVTVVFLPLGFTASIFSMSGSPERILVINVVVASIIALAVTVVTLMNTRALASVSEIFSKRFKDLTDRAKESSVMAENQKNQEKNDATPTDGEYDPTLLWKSSKDVSSWRLFFWISYIFVEVPAKSVAIAYHRLKRPWSNNKDLKSSIESERNGIAAESPGISKPRLIVRKLANYILVLGLVLGIYFQIYQQRTIEFLQKRIGKKAQMKKVAPVLLGFLILPLFLTSWILKTLYFILLDLLVYFGGESPHHASQASGLCQLTAMTQNNWSKGLRNHCPRSIRLTRN